MVVSCNYDTDKVVTIEGSVDGDEVAREVCAWDAKRPVDGGEDVHGVHRPR